MSLTWAAKSGKKFKRTWWNQWYSPGGAVYVLSAQDIVADDWIIEEDPKVCSQCQQELKKEPENE